MKLFTRIHEWAADRFNFVQYPNIRGPKPQFFKHQMPPMTRFFIALMSTIGLVIGLVLFVAFVFVFYSIVTA